VARLRGRLSTPRSKRLTSWEVGPEQVDGIHTASDQQIWSATVVNAGNIVTIVRLRGFVAMYQQVSSTAGTGFFGAHGIGLVSNEAVAVGATAVPGPLSEDDWDGWLWHSYFDVRAITGTIADGVNSASVVQRTVIDSKAMRKFDPAMTLIGVTEVVESNAGTLEVQGSSRMLIKV